MKATPFPQANKVLKAPPSRRAEIQQQIDDLAAAGIDVAEMQAKLDAALPREQEVYDLPVCLGEVEGVPRCISRWEPSPEERAAIAAGGPVWLWVVGTTHPPLVLDAQSPFEERQESPSSLVRADDALTIAGKLLQRLVDDGRMVSLRAVREAIPQEPEPIFAGAMANCQRHRKGRPFILIEEVEGG